MERRVNVYEGEEYRERIVARVRYTDNLDHWDGSNWTSGSTGMHKGITKLKDGRYVIIIGSQWQGSKDYGYIGSPEDALQEILKSGNEQLLDTKKFKELKTVYEEMMVEEEDSEEESPVKETICHREGCEEVAAHVTNDGTHLCDECWEDLKDEGYDYKLVAFLATETYTVDRGYTIHLSRAPEYATEAVVEDADGKRTMVDVGKIGYNDLEEMLDAIVTEYEKA